jgi:LAO/AO transport system kinase
MATRGSRGGLALSAQDSADIFDAAGFDVIIYETVGVGQVELDVASAADTTMVVLVPESGDDIQAMKAGLMEIADLFVINKADRPSANQALTQIQSMLEMRTHDRDEWLPPVLKTSALNGEGMPDLTAAIVDHQTYLQTHGKIKQNLKERTRKKIQQYIDANVLGEFWTDEKRQVLDSALSNDDLMGQQPSQIVTKLLS